ncbi:MAG: hypothetical protein SOZ59_09385 [Candidatus Limivivens sp.]|nr:hypothetical protein [Candidatus Limivivens sp.]
MEDCTIYYDDRKSSCRMYAKYLEEQEGILCRKASGVSGEAIIFEKSRRVGFLFESQKEHAPECIRNILSRIVMDKNGWIFLGVTGGEHELQALKTASEELERRGYQVSMLYSRFLMEKNHLDAEEAVQKILEDMEVRKAAYPALKEKIHGLTKKDLRKALRLAFRDYRSYQKKEQKKKV